LQTKLSSFKKAYTMKNKKTLILFFFISTFIFSCNIVQDLKHSSYKKYNKNSVSWKSEYNNGCEIDILLDLNTKTPLNGKYKYKHGAGGGRE